MLRRILRSIYDRGKNSPYRNLILLILCGSLFLSVTLLFADEREAQKRVRQITRRSYGQGEITDTFRVQVDGIWQDKTMNITVGEKQYAEEEIQEVFEQASKILEQEILGDNQSLDQIKNPMNLIKKIPGEPISVAWESDHYEWMNIYGEINWEKITEPVMMNLKATLTYTEREDMEMICRIPIRICPRDETEEEQLISGIQKSIQETEENTKTLDKVELPVEIEGKKVTIHRPRNYRGIYVLIMGIVLCGLLFALEEQNKKQRQKDREHQMMVDYPEVLNKLALLLGAGMNVKCAWERIVTDYESQKKFTGERVIYEEMANTVREMKSGVTEMESYNNFGKRCGVQAYRKLSAMLTQNLKKGTKGLTELMTIEASEAFEERKALAKRKGEEAGTKLLVPMFMMLATVLIIVIVPAFLSIQS